MKKSKAPSPSKSLTQSERTRGTIGGEGLSSAMRNGKGNGNPMPLAIVKRSMGSVSDKPNGKPLMGSVPRLHKLVPERVAEAVDKNWPSLWDAAIELDVTYECLRQHRQTSPWFQKIYQAVEAKHNGAVESVLYQKAVSGDDFTFNDRCLYLKAHMPDLYDRTKVVRVESVSMGAGQASIRRAELQNAVDAEIVNTVLDQRERKQLRRGELQVKSDSEKLERAKPK